MMRIFDDWLLLPQRFALHEPSATAVLADVHLGYSAARQRLGDAIPWRSVEEEMTPLTIAATSHDIRSLIVAGDLFERGFDAAVLAQWMDVLDRLKIRFLGLVPGNHDRGTSRKCVAALARRLRSCRLAHRTWRPTERRREGRVGPLASRDSLERPQGSLLSGAGRHLILPAFSLDAAGVDVRADARWQEWDCYAVHGSRINSPRRSRRTRR